MSTKLRTKAGFTLVEMMVIIPIALILIAVLVFSIIQLTNGAAINNQKTRRLADLNRALDAIEQDITVTNQFLLKPRLRDGNGLFNDNYIDYADYHNPQLSRSVRFGIDPVYYPEDQPPSNREQNQPRLILNRLATVTNPDADNIIKRLAHFKHGVFDTISCKYNQPVLFNSVYFVAGNKLYRRAILPRIDDGSGSKGYYFKRLFCEWTEPGLGLTFQEPWQLPTCAENLPITVNTRKYCRAHDQLVLDNAEIKVDYLDKDQNSLSSAIYDTSRTPEQRQTLLNEAVTVKVTLASWVDLGKGTSSFAVRGQVLANKLSDTPSY